VARYRFNAPPGPAQKYSKRMFSLDVAAKGSESFTVASQTMVQVASDAKLAKQNVGFGSTVGASVVVVPTLPSQSGWAHGPALLLAVDSAATNVGLAKCSECSFNVNRSASVSWLNVMVAVNFTTSPASKIALSPANVTNASVSAGVVVAVVVCDDVCEVVCDDVCVLVGVFDGVVVAVVVCELVAEVVCEVVAELVWLVVWLDVCEVVADVVWLEVCELV